MYYKYALLIHILSAMVIVGAHSVMSMGVLPQAQREASTRRLTEFMDSMGWISNVALLLQISSGLWLANMFIPDWSSWFSFQTLHSQIIGTKLLVLFACVGLSVFLRIRYISTLQVADLPAVSFYFHIMTVLLILLVVMGVSFRVGGFW